MVFRRVLQASVLATSRVSFGQLPLLDGQHFFLVQRIAFDEPFVEQKRRNALDMRLVVVLGDVADQARLTVVG